MFNQNLSPPLFAFLELSVSVPMLFCPDDTVTALSFLNSLTEKLAPKATWHPGSSPEAKGIQHRLRLLGWVLSYFAPWLSPL